MEEVINNVIRIMNTIPVEGISNMDKMIFCAKQLMQISNALVEIRNRKNDDKEEKEDVDG